jgi:ABC-type branched-subunit amino acid transport system substrate-binding protein
LLLRLVQIGDGTAAARRRVGRDTLVSQAPEPDRAAAVLEELAGARLVTADAESVEITHEALLGAWPRLRRWIETDRAGLHIHQQLTEAANAWAQAGKPPARLYRGTDLTLADDWAEDLDHRKDLSPVEAEFLAASRQLRNDQDRRRERLPRLFMMSAAVLLTVVAVPIGVWLVWSGFLLKSSCVDSGEVVESAGECIGVNGDGYDFRTKEITDVSRAIAKENQRVELGGKPHVTVAMMLPLDSEDAAQRQQMHSELLGAYLGQKEINEDPRRSNIRLVLANPGKSYDQQGKVVDTLLKMARSQDKLRAVTVSGSNAGSGEAENAVERLTEHHVPVLASPFGGDTIANPESTRDEARFPGLARITPTDREMVQALADWRGRSQDRKSVVVYDQRSKGDSYARSLRDVFLRIKEEGPPGLAPISFRSPAAGEADTTHNQFAAVADRICEYGVDTVYFAGRAPQLGSLVRTLAEAGCEGRHLTVVTGPDAASLRMTDRYRQEAGGITVQYVASGHPDAWRTEIRKWQEKSENPPQYLAEPAEAAQRLREQLRRVEAGLGAPATLDDSRTMMVYDGIITIGQALQLVQRQAEAETPSLKAVREGWALLNGQSRVRGTSGLICLSSDGTPHNKPVAVVESGAVKKGLRFVGMGWPDGKPQSKDCATPRR